MLARMTSSLPVARLAVLIDGENISHKLAPTIFREVDRFGERHVQRLYGDFDGSASGWAEAAARFALDPRHCFAPTPGKNAADIRLTIDAMNLLHAGGIDGFCIVSSDGDFAELAVHLRQEGKSVYGFGNGHGRLPIACDAYVALVPAVKPPASPPAATRPHPALGPIRLVLEQMEARDGWYSLATFGSEARRVGVNLKAFRTKKMAGLLRETGQFEVEPAEKPQRFRQISLRAVGA
ncbi:NYN domain-containing protein [Amaricoccus sp.]|uniref:NYN domain-containing protein n=1 Tax=Amaricoccus sp. TaxID=1872485 RepID=UPI00262DD7C4|nr:NYN domain-containing protein [Amaricoccus sp.]HRO12766.1 NYN domain-containing protein [Amaricoccus sp.]